MEKAGFLVLSGNLFDFGIMKTSVISARFRERYLNHPGAEGIFEGRAVVFEGADDYHHRINDPALNIDEDCILVMRDGRIIERGTHDELLVAGGFYAELYRSQFAQ